MESGNFGDQKLKLFQSNRISPGLRGRGKTSGVGSGGSVGVGVGEMEGREGMDCPS